MPVDVYFGMIQMVAIDGFPLNRKNTGVEKFGIKHVIFLLNLIRRGKSPSCWCHDLVLEMFFSKNQTKSVF